MKPLSFSCSLFVLCTLVFLSTNQAFAQDDNADLFTQLDKNKDGKLVASEIPADKRRFYDRLIRIGDKNEDGQLTKSEFQAATSPEADIPPAPTTDSPNRPRRGRPGDSRSAEQLFERLDRNKDGKLSRQEAPEPFGRLFDQLGKDTITLAELKAAQQKRGNTSGRPDAQKRPDGNRPAGQRAGTDQDRNPSEIFKRLDKNNDGKLTLAEVPEQLRPVLTKAFEKVGRDNTGSINKEEFVRMASKYGQSKTAQAATRNSDRPSGRDMQGQSRQGQGPAFLRLLDKNKDGALDRDELANAASMLATLDANKDGKLDLQELIGAQRSRTQRPDGNTRSSSRPDRPAAIDSNDARRKSDAVAKDRPALTDRVSGNVSREELLQRSFRQMDRNNDGGLSKDEAPSKLKATFDRVDSNGDGKIQLEELKKALSARKTNK
jgi:Ca2+-binding EF-hand superfamily protein